MINQNILVYKLFNINTFSKELVTILCGSFALAIATHIYIPFYPVPFTMQSLVVLIIGATLGRKLGTFSVIAFIIESIVGLPVIEGVSGFAIFAMPSFGYIIGFVFSAYIAGYMAEKGKGKKFTYSIPYLIIAHQIIFVFGVAYLSYILGSFSAGFTYGYLPFMGIDFVKVFLAATIIPLIWKISNKIS